MTIAVGILAADGIVIAADQQETSGWGTKSVADKVLSLVTPHGVIAVTGAGSAGHLDAMAQQVCGAFFRSKAGRELEAVQAGFGDFYAKHIIPLYPFNQRFPNCDIDAIIGVDTPRGRFILANEQTALRQCDGYVAVGSGASQASLVLSRTLIPSLPLERAALLAAYAIYTVKESVEGCGKNTDVYMLRDGCCYRFWHWDQEELDRQFKRYSDCEMVLLHHVLGRSGTIDDTLPAIEMTRSAIEKAVAKPRKFGPSSSPSSTTKRSAAKLAQRVSKPGRQALKSSQAGRKS